MAGSTKTPEEDYLKGWGCLLGLGIVGFGIWAIWNSLFGCFLADQFNYVTKSCALSSK